MERRKNKINEELGQKKRPLKANLSSWTKYVRIKKDEGKKSKWREEKELSN